MTFSKQIESRGRTEGERGVLSEKIFKDFFKEGSAKEGEAAGLLGDEPKDRGLVWPDEGRGGKSASENRGTGEMSIGGVEEGLEHNEASRVTPKRIGAEGGPEAMAEGEDS